MAFDSGHPASHRWRKLCLFEDTMRFNFLYSVRPKRLSPCLKSFPKSRDQQDFLMKRSLTRDFLIVNGPLLLRERIISGVLSDLL